MKKRLLDLYTDYLISSFGATTATGLSNLVNGEISHDAITRFLSEEAKTSANLWQVVKPLIREIENNEGIIVIDDSINEKPYTDENELICWHWDHSKGRNVKGINFLSALYEVDKVTLPVAFDLVSKTEVYIDAKSKKEKRKSTITKNQRYRKLLRVAVHNQIKFRYVVNDSWFASAENMKYIKHDLNKEFVMPLKNNRKIAVSKKEKEEGRYISVNDLELEEGEVCQVWLESVDFGVNLAKQSFTNEDGSTALSSNK